MVEKRKGETSRPFRFNKKRKSFTGKRKASASNESRSDPLHDEDDQENIFIEKSDQEKHTSHLFIDPENHLTIPSHNTKPNFETLERLNGAYEAMRRPNKRFKPESRIFQSLHTSSSSSSQQLLSPITRGSTYAGARKVLSRQKPDERMHSTQHDAVNAQSNGWRDEISDGRESLPPWQRNETLDDQHDTRMPIYQPLPASWPSSSTADEFLEWHNQPIVQRIKSSPIRISSIGPSEPSSSTAVQSSHQFWETDANPSKNIWLSQANSVASAPPSLKNPSNIYMDQMTEQDTDDQLYPVDELYPSTSSDAFSMQPLDQDVANTSILPSPIRRTNGIHPAQTPEQESHFPQRSDQGGPIPLSQNILVNFIKAPPKNKSLSVNGLDYFGK
ncbi:uncharacterized protein FA14DRAFT_183726 [Meira miltonrushii]|uniref:Uncharacterized protein n=1 Tax=Meira miltonrushii TaxID=1280837 RepID=A0A316VK84_9BASI|nr:uncharacterized protein FA14DRAFT_183726 [Meira miltonrushii]PWN38097.1 hypothetical protein FA14DRAFT_183726 [Meira miltonrushii]